MMLEIELKLRLEPENVALVYVSPVLDKYAQGDFLQQQLVSSYFDTANHDLRQQGFSLRLRKIGDQIIQTVKAAGNQEGDLHQRHEWEQETKQFVPDLSLLDDIDLQNKLRTVLGNAPLLPLFETNFLRTSWQLLLLDGAQIELALDQGEIKTNTQSDAICEVELELKNGDPAHLYEIADQLKATIPLVVEHRSKADRGFQLCMADHMQRTK